MKQYCNRTEVKEHRKKYMDQWHLKNEEYEKQYRIDNKEIIKDRLDQWRKDNPKKVRIQSKRYRENNLEKAIIRVQRWKRENPEKLKEQRRKYFKNKRKTNLKFNLNRRMVVGIWQSLKGNKNGHHWETLVGYTLSNLIKRLKETMPKGYTWQEFLSGNLHIDHKIPISVFNFNKPEHTDFRRCWALENLQLLPAKENIVKRDKLTKPFQPALRINI